METRWNLDILRSLTVTEMLLLHSSMLGHPHTVRAGAGKADRSLGPANPEVNRTQPLSVFCVSQTQLSPSSP